MPTRIVLSGYYGFGNTGDEAVLAGILATFREIGLTADVTVLSADPARTKAEHPGVESVHRYSPGGLIGAIRSADLVISGGGSLFQDVTSARSVRYYLAVLQLAQSLKKKTIIYAQGIGPLNAASTRRAVAGVLNKTRLITVRDQESKTLLNSIGVTRPEVHLTADPALVIEPDLAEADRIIADAGLTGAEMIGVSLRPWPSAQFALTEAAKGINAACDILEVKPALIPMQETEDTPICQAVNGALLNGSGRPTVVKGIISRCGLVVGMRLHALILAAGEGVPFVPLTYDPKVSSFATAAGVTRTLDVTSVTSDEMRDAVLAAWAERAALASEVAESSVRLRGLALESGKLAAALV